MIYLIAALFALLWSALRPGTQVVVKTAPTPRTAPTTTGTWFVAGLTDAGPSDRPLLVQSMDDFNRLYGGRVSYSILYDALDVFFREGGNAAWVSRVVGPAAVTASKNLLDAVAAVSLIVKALGPGAGTNPTSGNNLKVAVQAGTAGGTYQILIYDVNNNLLEQSPNLTTQQDAVTWSQGSSYVTISIGASANAPAVVAAAALAGGNDDRGNIVDAQWLTALNLFSKELGPGQISAPGRTTDVGHTQLLDHAAAKNRYAILDYPDTATQATLTTSATNAKATNNGQYGMGFAPWVLYPGVLAGTYRTVPPSALVAGAIARVDASDNPATPAAGDKGVSNYATGISQASWDASTRDALNTAGVNVIRSILGGVRIYGWRSLADPVNNPQWVNASVGRYLMSLVARAFNVGEQFVFDVIDGQGRTISAYQGALTALCQADWVAGMIYGASASDAFNVDTGPTVNTPTSLAGNELKAAVAVRPSPDAELVTINITNVPITQEVS